MAIKAPTKILDLKSMHIGDEQNYFQEVVIFKLYPFNYTWVRPPPAVLKHFIICTGKAQHLIRFGRKTRGRE